MLAHSDWIRSFGLRLDLDGGIPPLLVQSQSSTGYGAYQKVQQTPIST